MKTAPCVCRLLLMLAGMCIVNASTRPEAQIVGIGRMAVAPVLDGRLDDWPADATTILLGEAANTLSRPAKWEGTRDISGAVHLAWDATFLYFAAEVVDDKLMQAAATGAEPWAGDSMELFFNVHPGEQRKTGFWQVALVPPLVPGAKLAVLCPQGDFVEVEGTAKTRANGYTLECRIPWKNLVGFNPTEGAALGFQVMLNDRDGKGRKSQLCWYPSAVTYVYPLDMNVLHLGVTGAGLIGPPLLVGPSSAIITNPKQAAFSVLTAVPGAASVRISLEGAEPLVLPLEKSGEHLAVAAGAFPISAREGKADFTATVLATDGGVLAERRFQTELAGRRYVEMLARLKVVQSRLKSPALTAADPAALAGLGFWVQRTAALAANEARPEAVRAPMLDQMLVELKDIAGALDQLEQGKNPYAGRTGSFVCAYRSPLTGDFRPHSLYVPPSDQPQKPRPLIVVLHGIFGDDRHLFQQLAAVRNLGAIVYQAASYRQFDWADISAAETWAGLDQVLAEYAVDHDRIYLIGHHIGGRGVLQLAMDRPDLFAALAPMYPGIDTKPAYAALRLYPQYYEQAALGNLIPAPIYKTPPAPAPLTDPLEKKIMEMLSLATRAENIAALPIRLVHGEAQPDAAAERLALLARLQTLGAQVAVRHEIGAQHGNQPTELDEPEFYRWLLDQRRPPAPQTYSFTATGLRDNAAWLTRIDALTSPVEPGRVKVVRDGKKLTITTTGVSALSPLLKGGEKVALVIDGQSLPDIGTDASLMRDADGKWSRGSVPMTDKHHGLSGPIDDFQFGRFIYIYGTLGAAEETTALEKATRKLANRGLGTDFTVKADRDLTDEDRASANLVLVGTPQTNAVLAKIAGKLPLKWDGGSLRIGETSVTGPGAGACMIYPNPETAGRYVVIITAADDSGYKVWAERAGVDYVLVHGAPVGGTTEIAIEAHGLFDNHWKYDPTLLSKPETTQ